MERNPNTNLAQIMLFILAGQAGLWTGFSMHDHHYHRAASLIVYMAGFVALKLVFDLRPQSNLLHRFQVRPAQAFWIRLLTMFTATLGIGAYAHYLRVLPHSTTTVLFASVVMTTGFAVAVALTFPDQIKGA